MKESFNDVISKLLNERLKKLLVESVNVLNSSTCLTVYNVIFNSLTEVFEKSQVQISNESMNYIAQQYYKCIDVNGTEQGLDPNIFTQQAKLSNIETRELALLAMMLRGSGLEIPIFYEIKHRS